MIPQGSMKVLDTVARNAADPRTQTTIHSGCETLHYWEGLMGTMDRAPFLWNNLLNRANMAMPKAIL